MEVDGFGVNGCVGWVFNPPSNKIDIK